MTDIRHGISLSFCLCIMLAACTPPTKKADVLDLYELPQASGHTTNSGMIDNDSYYTQPGSYKGCAVINDAPSCGGG